MVFSTVVELFAGVEKEMYRSQDHLIQLHTEMLYNHTPYNERFIAMDRATTVP